LYEQSIQTKNQTIQTQFDKEYPLSRSQFLEKFERNNITGIPRKQKLGDILREYKDVFSTSEDKIRLIQFHEHPIPTTRVLVAKQPYRIPY